MAIQKAKYEALSDFSFRNVKTGLFVCVHAADQYKILEIDRDYGAVRINKIGTEEEYWISLIKFATHFVEVKND